MPISVKGPISLHTLRHAMPGSQSTRVMAPEQTWPAALDSVPEARRFTASTLTLWGLPDTGSATDAAVQVVSELVANAVRATAAGTEPAAGSVVLLRLSLTRRAVIVQAGDKHPAPPPRPSRRNSAEAENGRGMQIARALSLCLGWYTEGGWKIVWAAVPLSGGRRWPATWTRRHLGWAA